MLAPNILTPGLQLYKFTLIEKIGSGNFGNVWKAKDNALDCEIALKILINTNENIINQLHEARVGNRLDHKNLIKIHYADIIQHENLKLICIAMNYIPGGACTTLKCPGNFIAIDTAINLIKNATMGLEHLHHLNFFHNDIKPGNIMVGANGEGILSDYGICSYSPNNAPVCPSSNYLPHCAPEILSQNTISVKTDIYQLGLTLFRMTNNLGLITNKFSQNQTKFREDSQKGKIITDDDYQPFIPPVLKRIIKRAVHHDPNQRYGSALDVRRDLEKIRLNGSWIIDASGNYIGNDDKFNYSFQISKDTHGLYAFNPQKISKRTGHRQNHQKFAQKGLTQKELKKATSEYMLSIVDA